MVLTTAVGEAEAIIFGFFGASPFGVVVFHFLWTAGLKRKNNISILFVGIISASFLTMAAWESINEEPSIINFLMASFYFFSVLSLLYIWYVKRIKGFTIEGAHLAAELDGFKLYLKTAEEHRLNMLNPPDRTPELFEKLLPYTIALGVSNKWCEKFGDVLKQHNYAPEWFDTDIRDDFTALHLASTFAALGSSFNSSVSSAQTSHSSGSDSWSSGSGGGGYSGGGGGGGGGRGW
jgi:uncharacterized membrane protein